MKNDHYTSKLCKVLQFALTHLENMSATGLHSPNEAESDASQTADKILGETALLIIIASRVPGANPELKRTIQRLAELLAKVARTPRHQVLLLRFPATAAAFALTHVALESAGLSDETFGRVLQSALQSGQLSAVERPAFRNMDVAWTLAQLHGRPYDCEALVAHSILKGTPHPIYMTRTDAYAFTHALMFGTDFGRKSLPAALCHREIAAVIDAALAWHIATGDFDLLGEFLMAAEMTGHDSAYTKAASELVIRTWDAWGFVPSPHFSADDYRRQPPANRVPYAFQRLYHTMYVMGLWCCLKLIGSREQQEPGTTEIPSNLASQCERAYQCAVEFARDECVQEPAEDGDTLADLIAAVQPTGSRALQACLEDGAMKGNELETVLLDALLIRSAREYDLASLAKTLRHCATKPLYLTPSFIAATEFLLRQQLPCGAIGAAFVHGELATSREACQVTAWLGEQLRHVGLFVRQGVEKGGGSNN